jgi:hypothetical protein
MLKGEATFQLNLALSLQVVRAKFTMAGDWTFIDFALPCPAMS